MTDTGKKEKRNILQTFTELQTALEDVASKKIALDKATAARDFAAVAHGDSVEAAQLLKDELQGVLELMLPDNRVRVG